MFNAYEVAVKLKLVDHFSAVMGMATNHLIKANGHAEKLQKSLTGVGKLLTAGVATTGAGVGIALALKASTTEAVKYEQQLNRLKALNLDARLGPGTTAGLEKRALEIAKSTKGTSGLDALKLVTEAQSITGDVHHTLDVAPLLARMKFGLETYMSANGKGEGHGEQSERQFQDIVKVMEMRGLMRNFSEEKLDRMADLFVKNYVASGGVVKPSEFLAMMKTGGVAAKSVGEDYLFALGHIMQENGGSRAGTMLMSGYQNLVAGRTTQQVAEQLEKYGLLKKDSIEYGSTGHIKKVKPEALIATEAYIESPLKYLNEYILPAISKKGVDINDVQRVIPILNQMLSNKNAANQMVGVYLERAQIANYIEQAKAAMGVNALYKQGEESFTGEELDLRKKIVDLDREMGKASLPLVKNALEQTIPLVKSFGEWLGKNPEGLSMLVKGIAGLGIAMAVSGPLMVVGSGIRLLSVGTSLLAGPLGNFSVAMAMRGVGGASGIASLASNLGTVGGQLKLLGAAAALFISYEIGKWAGGKIYEHLEDDTKDTIGGTIATVLSWLGNEDAKNTLESSLRQREHPGAMQVPIVSRARTAKDATSMAGALIVSKALAKPVAQGSGAAALATARNPKDANPIAGARPPVVTIRPAASRDSGTAPGGAAHQKQPVQVVANTYLDSRLIQRTVTDSLVRDMSHAPGNANSYDGSMSPTFPSQVR